MKTTTWYIHTSLYFALLIKFELVNEPNFKKVSLKRKLYE